MQVLNLCKKHCNNLIPSNLGERIGDGADGEVFSLTNDSSQVIKLGVIFEYSPSIDIHKSYNIVKNNLSYLQQNSPVGFAKVIEHGYYGAFEREFGDSNQKFIIFYYIMEKLNKLSTDEIKVFHSILSHEDMNLNKNFSSKYVKEMLHGMSYGLEFDMNKVLDFYNIVKTSKVKHNDIHPRNIMKTNSGIFKFIDFERLEVI